MENKRVRGYCFTINNPTEWDSVDLDLLQQENNFQYLIYGKEKGENNTPHLQGYVHFKSTVRFNKIKKLLPRAHIEAKRGTAAQAIEYCKKEGDYQEYGEVPVDSGTKTKMLWKNIIDLAKNGDLQTIEDEYPSIYLRYLPRLKSLKINQPVILNELTNEWWYGSTGTGKSKKLWNDYPDHFQKEKNKWWDGYNNEDVVGIEEWSPANAVTADALKIWSDRYPFTGQIKGGTLLKIRPKKIIVCSNYTIKECFPDPRDHEPLLRRFKQIHFKSLIDYILND